MLNLKAFADDKLNVAKIMDFVPERLGNIGKAKMVITSILNCRLVTLSVWKGVTFFVVERVHPLQNNKMFNLKTFTDNKLTNSHIRTPLDIPGKQAF